jgi:hypothetical protein
MTHEIKAGSILVKESALLPKGLQFESEPCTPGWRLVKDFDGYGLDRKIQCTGWTFFWLAEEMKAIAFGIDGQTMVRGAIKRILANSESERFNSLQITRMVSNHFLGVPYAVVYAHRRHIQESISLFRDEQILKRQQTKISGGVSPSVGRAKNEERPLGESLKPTHATSGPEPVIV